MRKASVLTPAKHFVRLQDLQNAARQFHDADQRRMVGRIANHDHATNHIGMAAQVLGGAVHDKIGTVFNRTAEIGGGKGVIHDQPGANAVGNVGACR